MEITKRNKLLLLILPQKIMLYRKFCLLYNCLPTKNLIVRLNVQSVHKLSNMKMLYERRGIYCILEININRNSSVKT